MLPIQKKLTNLFYVILSLPATAMGFALCIQISALSWILSTKYGLKIDEIGLVWAAGPIAGILGQVVIGLISDNVWLWNGRRRPFIIIGGVLAALMLLALPNIDVISKALGIDGILGVAIVVALTLDLAINVSFNPTRSIIADVTPEGKERTKGYTWMQTISGTFGVLAYVIGAFLNNYVLIYFGVFLVLVLSVIPSFFIEEPRELKNAEETAKQPKQKTSFVDTMKTIQPLWGFLLYAVYAMTKKLGELHIDNYYFEYFCLALTIILIIVALLKSETGQTPEKAGMIAFNKVLAAHSFTWIGVQTMFVYMFSYIQHNMTSLNDNDKGQIVSISFLILNAVGAVLPVFVLEPITRKIGRVRTHAICIASMALGYLAVATIGFSAITIYILMAFLGIGWASTISLPFAIMTQKVDKGRIGLYMGLFNLSVVLPQLVASLGVGQAIANNPNLTFYVCSATLCVSAIAWFLTKDTNTDHLTTTTAMGGGGH